MRRILLSSVILLLTTVARAEEKSNALTPEQAAEGWKLLFDGKSYDGLRISGDFTTEEGEFVLGRNAASRVGPRETLAGDFEWRMEYRVTGPGTVSILLEQRGAFSGWSSSQSISRPSNNPEAWRSLRITGRIDPQTGVCSLRLHQDGADQNAEQRLGDYHDTMNVNVALQVSPGTRLHLRNIKLKADPPSQKGLYSLYVMVGGLVAVVIALVLFVYWRSVRRRALEN